MSDYNDLIRFSKAKLSTAIVKHPPGCKLAGKFGLVGSMPMNLTLEKKNALGQTIHKSLVWDTEQEAIDAILNEGIDKFQLSDCTWYSAEVT